jgi:hypothetical protein
MKLAFPKWMAASTALAGLLAVASAAEAVEKSEAAAKPVAVDVALAPGGLLRGQVVDAQGVPQKGTSVSLWHENQQVAQTVSDLSGQFSVTGLRGGVHQVVAGQNQGVYRLWTAQAAPPTARPGTIVVSGAPVIRAQNGQMGRSFLTSPVLWGGVAYAAGHVIGFNSGIDHSPSSP